MKILVLSDVHADFAALQTAFDNAPPHEAILCLGDIVGYGAQPNECCDFLRERGARCLLGNHDAAALGDPIIQRFKASAQQSARWTSQVLTPENRAFLASLSPHAWFEDWQLEAVHGSLDLPLEGYVQGRYSAQKTFDAMRGSLCFFGHTHFAAQLELLDVPGQRLAFEEHDWRDGGSFAVREGGWRTLVNPGSVGKPRDGSARVRFGRFDASTRQMEVFALDSIQNA